VTLRARGFTLVEVLIAMGITAVMAVMTVGSLRGIDHASGVARVQAERYGAARLALTRLSRELTVAFLSKNFDTNRYREAPTLFVGREDELLFTTFAHSRWHYRDAKESDQAVVEYTLESDPGSSGEQALFRREKARIDDEADRGGRKDLVAEHVAGFRLQYWDAKRKDWSREWSTRSVDHADDLPSRVRLELELKLADGRTEKLVTEARVALTRPLDF
jgi:general secretion pathway protein J